MLKLDEVEKSIQSTQKISGMCKGLRVAEDGKVKILVWKYQAGESEQLTPAFSKYEEPYSVVKIGGGSGWNGKVIEIGGKEIEFPQVAGKIIEREGKVVVLLGSYNSSVPKNVVAYNSEAEMLWEIQKVPRNSWFRKRSRYVDIFEQEDGKLVAVTDKGAEFLVDMSSGRVKKK